MLQVYICIGTVILAVALSIGLVSGFMIMPLETTHEQFYILAGKIAIIVALLVSGLIFLLIKTGHIKIDDVEKLIKNR